jgi:hypothetical protein
MSCPRKAQGVRLFDVFLLGPALLWLGVCADRQLRTWERVGLAAVGAGTILYNGRNYLQIEAENRNNGPSQYLASDTPGPLVY